jgi:hypothetical protein
MLLILLVLLDLVVVEEVQMVAALLVDIRQ